MAIFFPAVNKKEGMIVEPQFYCNEHYENKKIITGLVDDEIIQSISIAYTLLLKENIEIPRYMHLHFPDYNYCVNGVSAALGIYFFLYFKIKNESLRNDYLMTGEVDLQGNILSVGMLKQKVNTFVSSKCNFFFIPRNSIKMKNSVKGVIEVESIKDVLEWITRLERTNTDEIK
ncbi:MAG: hypothetical protein J6J42_08665 [Lachnospiraceae bacterium]|nr:hypothetical protein [Lachnospiraceae bacterium]